MTAQSARRLWPGDFLSETPYARPDRITEVVRAALAGKSVAGPAQGTSLRRFRRFHRPRCCTAPTLLRVVFESAGCLWLRSLKRGVRKMRVLLTLSAARSQARLPLNYNHAVASLIYGILGSASEKFAAMLHDTGFEVAGRRFKLFTFSRLMPRASHVAGGNLVLDDPQVELLISSPLREFVETFVAGLFQSETFRIDREEFHLEAAQTLAAPEFSSPMTFRALSPITETVPEAGREHARFLSVNDSDELWSEIIGRNLSRKYVALHQTEPEDTSLRWEWDREYIEQYESRGKRASVLLSIGSGPEEIKVRGWLAPFTVSGSIELIRLGYEAGYGSRNSIGFGMVE